MMTYSLFNHHLTRTIFLVVCPLFFSGLTTFGQSGNSDRCTVTAIDVTKVKVEEFENAKEIVLGKFDTVIGEETGTTRIYRLPKTRHFVLAHAWYTDESLASEKGADSISLELTVSTRRKRDVLSSLAYVDAELPLNDFDVARVTTKVKSGLRTFLLIMECRKNIRVNSHVRFPVTYPAVWFAAINDPNKPGWEIPQQEAKAGEVILSKRNEPGVLSNFAATPFEPEAAADSGFSRARPARPATLS